MMIKDTIIKEESSEISWIEHIDTRIKRFNLATYMIDRYESKVGKMLLPQQIIDSASGFWKKWLQRSYSIDSCENLKDFQEEHDIEVCGAKLPTTDRWVDWTELDYNEDGQLIYH